MNKIFQILPNIYGIKYNNSQSLGLSFIRFQESYEGQFFKDKVFTLKEYKQWYCKNMGNGYFDYCRVYVGFNLPDYAFDTFLQGKFNPLRDCEKNILEQIKDLPRLFCLIGLNTKSLYYDVTLRHEIAHGFWYVDKEYRKEMKKLLRQIQPKARLKLHTELKLMGYHPDMYNDEIQAYMTEDEYSRFFEMVSLNLRKKFQKVYDKRRIK